MTRSLEDDWFGPVTSARLTEDECKFLAPFKESLIGDGDAFREEGVPLEEPQGAEDEYSGLEEDQDFWFDGIDFVHRDEDGEIDVAGCILPSERFYGPRDHGVEAATE